MALATQCPHCKTTFRVAHDQLKLRAGLVRCGSCKQIFNGIENLLRPDVLEKPVAPATAGDTVAGIAPVSAAPEQRMVPGAPRENPLADQQIGPSSLPDREPPRDFSSAVQQDTATTIVRSNGSSARSTDNSSASEDPMLRMTLLDISANRAAIAEERERPTDISVAPVDPLDRVIDELRNRPLRQDDSDEEGSFEPEVEADASLASADVREAGPRELEDEEPGFVKQARRRRRWKRTSRFLMTTGSLLLLLAGLVQATVLFRDHIAARFPEIRPLLEEACAQIGCEIRLPAQIERVSIESDELTASPTENDTLALLLVLRNRSTVPQAWPDIELTLNDSEGKAILRKVFRANDYVPAAEAERGLAAGAEQTVQIRFSLSQVKAAGYRVYLFYP